MAAGTTGVDLDNKHLVNLQFPMTAVEASTPHVVWELAAPVGEPCPSGADCRRRNASEHRDPNDAEADDRPENSRSSGGSRGP